MSVWDSHSITTLSDTPITDLEQTSIVWIYHIVCRHFVHYTDFFAHKFCSYKKSPYLCIAFESYPLHKQHDSLAQLVEHNTFNVGVLGSSPRRITKTKRKTRKSPENQRFSGFLIFSPRRKIRQNEALRIGLSFGLDFDEYMSNDYPPNV